MRAIIKADPSRGPGHAIIEIAGAAAGSPNFLLQRASDSKVLTSAGWQESGTPLLPDAWDNDSGLLRLAVGPAVVDELDSLDAYRISLPGQGHCGLGMENIIYSHMQGGQGMGRSAPAGSEPTPQPEPAPEPVPVPEPVPTPEPASPPQTEPQPTAQPAPQVAETPPKRSRLPLLIALLLLLAGLGAALWWFFLREPATPPLPNPGQSAPAAVSPLQMAREHLRGQADPALSLELARPLRAADATPEACDAAFLLLEDAAQKGNAEAMLLVGQYYDPVDPLPKGSIPADMAQARHWYGQALQQGQQGAAQALAALRVHVQGKADAGDAEARLLLRQWPQGE